MENNSFIYTYSAKEQYEINRIRDKYVPKEADNMEQLRILDRSVGKKAKIKSLIVGIAGALVMGIGMSFAMVWKGSLFIPVIIIGLIGIAGVAVAYTIYNKTFKKERTRIAPEILRMTEELMK